MRRAWTHAWARAGLWLVLAAALAVGVAARWLDTLPAPPAHASVAPSVLYDRNGTPIAEIGPSIEHASLGLEEVAPALVDAVIAVLDPSFLQSDGVDPRSYSAIFGRGMADGRSDGIMRRYLDAVQVRAADADPSVATDARLLLAELRLSRLLSRPEILERYINVVYLGRGAYGVRAAAAAWYGIAASDLSVTQAAFLVSLIDAPAGVDPATPDAEAALEGALGRETARQRRDLVLLTMFENGYLTADELAAGRATPVEAGLRPASDLTLEALQLDDAAGGLVKLLAPEAAIESAVRGAYAQLRSRYGVHRVVTSGLHVTTSIDLAAQQAALTAAREWIDTGTGGRLAELDFGEQEQDEPGEAEETGEPPAPQIGEGLAPIAAPPIDVTGVDAVVRDRAGEVRVMFAATQSGEDPALGSRPLGALFDDDLVALSTLLADIASPDVVRRSASVAQAAAAFSVAATQGEARDRGLVLEVAALPPQISGRDIDRWPLVRTQVLTASDLAAVDAALEPLTLPTGVEAMTRAAAADGAQDVWFAGFTSHYSAALRMTLASPAEAHVAIAHARELFVSVMAPLQFAPTPQGSDSG